MVEGCLSDSLKAINKTAHAMLRVMGAEPLASTSDRISPSLRPLLLDAPRDELLSGFNLKLYPISPSARNALEEKYVEMCNVWTRQANAHYLEAYYRLTALSTPEASYLESMQAAFRRKHAQGLSRMQDVLIQCIRDGVTRFNNDLFPEHKHDSATSNLDTAHGVSHGHSTAATALLEKAFERAHSITMAEKHRLAAATGLEPRQVTIWVSTLAMSSRASRVYSKDAPTVRCPAEKAGTDTRHARTWKSRMCG
ncbi:hypothetical protein IE81DRAFT_167305 [Ceraceosorus guamensis]|uniref:Homeobox domain-containing protein n=1 Tax=Ceraceosorus guamensis TaxID=1522189 RepID=A0A316W819_9BASI|nr:hypothetical protein IE81DRAFT_167305 [Ceraceosorus guamensis]PWN45734.1 hypothetical protein IE81DRAFT_167305 [Ceraceosorus guamensis]